MGMLNRRVHWMLFFLCLLVRHSAQASTNSNSPWEFEFGSRYWLASSNFSKDLFGPNDNLLSRLTQENVTNNTAEGFWRLNHTSGVFLKGYFGGGTNNGGEFIDQDFPPGIVYSRTKSDQKNGAVNYFSVDLGYSLLMRPQWNLSAFIGYHYWLEHYNTFGCAQTAVGSPFCSHATIPATVNGLNENVTWNSLRIGVNSTIKIIDRLDFTIDAAYIRSNLNGNDFHNLRSDIRGVGEDGQGNGVQLEGIFNWELSRDLTVGMGGRWWYVSTKGYTRFDQTAASGQPQGITVNQNTYGLLLQTNYKFDDSTVHQLKEPLIFDWNGAYLGANIGYGTNPSDVLISPLSVSAHAIEDQTPFLLNLQSRGFLGGGQGGYNWQINKVIVGIEGDIDYAHLSGANATTLEGPPNYSTSVSKNLQWLGTLRARLGKLASPNLLVYGTAGAAWGGAQLAFDQRNVAAFCTANLCSTGNATKTKTGGTVGAGIEYSVNRKTTFKAEYLYLNLGNVSLNTFQDAQGNTNYNVSSSFVYNIVRLGVNYKL